MRFAAKVCVVTFASVAIVVVATPYKAAAVQGQGGGVALVMPSPIPVRAALADMVVTGKVAKIEDKTVSAPAFPGVKDSVEYQIAVVKIDDALLNAKGLKEVRVGFAVQKQGGIAPRGYKPASLSEGEEVILFLTKHFDADFYTMPQTFSVIKKANNANFEKELEETKKAAKLLADPMASLKAKDASDRYLVAAMLIERYCTAKQSANPPRQEAIDAAESKLILEALHDGDWSPPPPGAGNGWQLTPLSTFLRLGLSKDDNWAPPAKVSIHDSAKTWLKENADVYRIKRFVYESKDKESEKKDK
jgi:hypothetical protein